MPAKRRSRNVFYSMFCSVVILHLVVFAIVESKPIAWRDPEFGLRFERFQKIQVRYQRKFPNRPWVALVGSSLTSTSFFPEKMPCNHEEAADTTPMFYNFGVLRVLPAANLLHIQRLLQLPKHPDVIVLEFVPAHLTFGSEQIDKQESVKVVLPKPQGKEGETIETWQNRWEHFVPKRYSASEILQIQKWSHDPNQVWQDWFEHRWCSIYSMRTEILTGIAPKLALEQINNTDDGWRDLTDWGWLPYPPFHAKFQGDAARFYIDRIKPDMQRRFQNGFQPSPECREILDEIARLCQANQIPLYFFIPPVCAEIRTVYTPKVEESLQLVLQEYRQKFAVQVIDARDWLSDEAFAEGFHLIFEQVPGFSKLFSERAIPMIQAHLAHLRTRSSLE